MPAKFILHTVGPIFKESRAEECGRKLQGCYESTLKLAVEHEMRTVALCGVSTGVYGFPLRDATEIALSTTRAFLDKNESKVGFLAFLLKYLQWTLDVSLPLNSRGNDRRAARFATRIQFDRVIFCNFGDRDVKIYSELAVGLGFLTTVKSMMTDH